MRELATYPVTILFGVAVAGVLARVIALWWPRAGVATFIVLASAWALVGAAKMLRALRGGRNSALAIIFERIGAFCPVFGLALLIGELFARIGSDARLIADLLGVWVVVIALVVTLRDKVQTFRLQSEAQNPSRSGATI
jgi:hypothetical protein